jgi:hypothetical protein
MTTQTITLPASDPRGTKAVQIATDAGQWLKCRTRDGRKYYGIQSSLGDGCYYLVTRTSCTCYDAQERHNECKHMLAVRLHCALVDEQRQAAKYDDIFARFEQDEDRAMARILGGPAPWTRQQRGVIPASEIERED